MDFSLTPAPQVPPPGGTRPVPSRRAAPESAERFDAIVDAATKDQRADRSKDIDLDTRPSPSNDKASRLSKAKPAVRESRSVPGTKGPAEGAVAQDDAPIDKAKRPAIVIAETPVIAEDTKASDEDAVPALFVTALTPDLEAPVTPIADADLRNEVPSDDAPAIPIAAATDGLSSGDPANIAKVAPLKKGPAPAEPIHLEAKPQPGTKPAPILPAKSVVAAAAVDVLVKTSDASDAAVVAPVTKNSVAVAPEAIGPAAPVVIADVPAIDAVPPAAVTSAAVAPALAAAVVAAAQAAAPVNSPIAISDAPAAGVNQPAVAAPAFADAGAANDSSGTDNSDGGDTSDNDDPAVAPAPFAERLAARRLAAAVDKMATADAPAAHHVDAQFMTPASGAQSDSTTLLPMHVAPTLTANAAAVQAIGTAGLMASASMPFAEAAPGEDTVAQLVQSLRFQLSRGVGEAQIRLEPRHFGDVTVGVRVEQGQVVARLQVEAPSVREWLQTNQAWLRTGLAEHGLTLDRLEVSEPADTRNTKDDRSEGRHQAAPGHDQQGRRFRRPDTGQRFEVFA